MMFIVRSGGEMPMAAAITIKASRRTPAIVSGDEGKTDYFCVGEPDAMVVLREAGWQVVELRDGWYAGDNGGGVAISGHGRYWEIRDTLFTVKEAVGKEAVGPATGTAPRDADLVNVRRAIFGV
jgi:hypothetical protein